MGTDTDAFTVAATYLVLALLAAVCHATLLVALILHKRNTSSINSRYTTNRRNRENSKKRNVSSYFFISLWLCLLLHLLTRISHDIPSVFAGRHIYGSNIASIVAWFARCLLYSSVAHTALIVAIGYCNRFDFGATSATTVMRCTCLASRMRAVLATLATWLLSVAVATVVKFGVCEYQFDPRMYGYVCVYSIHYEGGVETPSSQLNKEQGKTLLYIDGTIIGLITLLLTYWNWAIRKLTMKRWRVVEQARSVLSVSDGAFQLALNPNSSTQDHSGIARMRSNRLIALTVIFIIRSGCYLLVIDSGQNRWYTFTFTIIDYLYLIMCPVLYIMLTQPLRSALTSWQSNGQENGQIALSDMGGPEGAVQDDHSLYSDAQNPTTFISPATTDHISTASLSPMAEKSPFSADNQLNNSPSLTSHEIGSCDTVPVQHQFLRPQRNRLTPGSSARSLKDKVSTVLADVHRSDIYAISSFHSFGPLDKNMDSVPKSAGSIPGYGNLVAHGRSSIRVLPKSSRHKQSRRSDQFSGNQSQNGPLDDRKRDQEPPSPALTTADGDSAASDTCSMRLTRAVISLNRRKAWTKQDSMENYEPDDSLKERAAAARKFVEAYEAKNARLNHSLTTAGDRRRSVGVACLGNYKDTGRNGLSAVDEGGINMKRMAEHLSIDDFEIRANEKRCHHDG